MKITPWYSKLMASPDDYTPVMEAYDFYMEEYEKAMAEANELSKEAKRAPAMVALKLPGIYSYRWNQLQEMDQILAFLENREKRVLGQKRRQFREHYARELNDSMVEKYAETDTEVLDIAETRNFFGLVRNKFLGVTKCHEYLHFQLHNIAKLRDAGIEGS